MEIKHRTELNKLMPKRKLIGAEVGVAEGLNANDMLTNWNLKKLYLVDAWECMPTHTGDAASDQKWHDLNHKNVLRLMEMHKGKFKILRGLSTAMAKNVIDESLDFVYIDCDHSYEGVMKDLESWTPKVKKGGVIAGHDYLNPVYYVNKAVKDFTKGKYKAITIPENKEEDAGFYFIKK
tara:strand:- start:2789 stop:3325 length:537 start_codon:yes stop_codon:yes gene_type:complete